MEFIGREKELGLLKKENKRRSSFILLTGRRRIGKTRLIKEFFEDKDSLYFLATSQNKNQLLDDFSNSVSQYTGLTASFKTWTEAFKFITSIKKERKYLAIDEFQYLLTVDPGAKKEFQYIWDEILSESEVCLIVCGSHISVLKNLAEDESSPLYGRFTRHITLKQLPFSEIVGDDYRGSLEKYAVLGGVPRYMELFGNHSLIEGLEECVYDPTSMMFDDPYILLQGEVQNTVTYMSVMKAIAAGNRKLSGIAGAIETSATTLPPYLKKLTDIGMVYRDVPVTEKYPDKSKTALYNIADNYTAFWFRFVYPFSSQLTMGKTGSARKMLKDQFIDNHASFIFEDVCRELTWDLTDSLGFIPEKIGRWWNKTTEIDLVAINDTEKKIFIAECKYWSEKPVSHKVLSDLIVKTQKIEGISEYTVKYGLFSVTGFDQSLISEKEVVLVDQGKVLVH